LAQKARRETDLQLKHKEMATSLFARLLSESDELSKRPR
jgi:hypothetical protein